MNRAGKVRSCGRAGAENACAQRPLAAAAGTRSRRQLRREKRPTHRLGAAARAQTATHIYEELARPLSAPAAAPWSASGAGRFRPSGGIRLLFPNRAWERAIARQTHWPLAAPMAPRSQRAPRRRSTADRSLRPPRIEAGRRFVMGETSAVEGARLSKSKTVSTEAKIGGGYHLFHRRHAKKGSPACRQTESNKSALSQSV
jgi:hypothetical protein